MMITRFDAASDPDYMPRATLDKLQNERFMATFTHVFNNVPWYRNRLEEHGVRPDEIQSIRDIVKLPFVIKTDLRDTYPFGMFAVPMNEIVRFHASSGTTGKPIVVSYTDGDIKIWRSVVARALAAMGINRYDVLQNSYGYGLFTGGLGLHYGGEEHHVTVIPMGGGNTERQIMLMRDFCVTAVSCTPSYFLHLIDKGREMGVDLKTLPVRIGVFGGEPWTEEMRHKIEEEAGIKAYDIYGLTEIIGPGVGCECVCQTGSHVFEDHFYPEIIDPETLEPLPDGEQGELVFTTLTKRAMPMLRYRTRDITRIINEPCKCGRTIRRIQRISHRSDDMFIIRGVNVFPGQIEAALLGMEGTLPHYQIILTRDNGLDNIEVQVELDSARFGDTLREVEIFRKQLAEKIQHTIGIRVSVKLVETGVIPRSEGKAKRVLDKRTM
ncbi:MAG: phenylacetate--CoA ligase [Planctomycetia bacterium]|nr:phenylacetate--CoA ligase [Planctomycetia bacterium]